MKGMRTICHHGPPFFWPIRDTRKQARARIGLLGPTRLHAGDAGETIVSCETAFVLVNRFSSVGAQDQTEAVFTFRATSHQMPPAS